MNTRSFEPVIGLEVHAELLTQSKMFCACSVVDSTTAEPNTSVCEICTGMPGTLPVINRRAVEFALRVALALHCEIAATSLFARKNYFYPDLPKGYQISQYELPLAKNGRLPIAVEGAEKQVRIRRVHLEEDTGKLFHHPGYSLVDYNRSGVPLLEIVSEPDLHSMDEVKAYAMALRSLLRYLQVNSGDMEKGVIRFEANVSVRPLGSDTLGTRTEIKNLNSFRAVVRAVEYEIQRQSECLSRGETVIQETVGWDEARGVTVAQRGKEEAHDYRYFPEPDLPPLHVEAAWIDEIRAQLPELPSARRSRFVETYGLTPYTAETLTAERQVADYFEAAVDRAPSVPPESVANWLTSTLFGLLNEAGLDIGQCQVSPQALASLVSMVEQGEINATTAKSILTEIFPSGGDPREIVAQRGLAQVSDRRTIDTLVHQVLRENPEQVEQYLAGKSAVIHWFFGQVMRAAEGKANPEIVRISLETALKALEEESQP